MRIKKLGFLRIGVAIILSVSSLPYSRATQGFSVVQLANIQVARALEGTVVDPADSPVAGVEVCEMSPEWKTVLRTTKTDKDGKWSLSQVRGRNVYYLRFTAYGFDPLEVRIKISRMKSKKLRFKLVVAT